MAQPQVHILRSTHEVAAIGERWNDLWRRSDVTSPVLRSEFLRNWSDSFAADRDFRAVIVEEGDRLVAALPMVEQKWAKVIPVGGLPCNEWSLAGDLLLDPACDTTSVLKRLGGSLGKLGWPLCRLSFVRVESPEWRGLRSTLETAGMSVECRPSYDVTYIDTPPDWETYRRTWSKNHRHRLGGRLRRLNEQGTVRLNRVVPANCDEATPLLDRALAIEDSGWKGREGTSVLKSPAIADYLRRLAALLIPQRELELAFLELNGQPLAFEILFHAKGILHSYKVGYDEQFEWYDPGHLLMHELLREAAETRRCTGYDCLGPNSVGLRRWRGSIYPIGQLVIAPSKWLGPALMFTYRRCRRPSIAQQISPGFVESDQDERGTNQPGVGQGASASAT